MVMLKFPMELSEVGPDHDKSFEAQVILVIWLSFTNGTDKSKKSAEMQAAQSFRNFKIEKR